MDDTLKNGGSRNVWEAAETNIQILLKSKFTDEELERNEELARKSNEQFRLNRDNNYAKQTFYKKIDLDKYPSLKKFIDIIFDPNKVLEYYRSGYMDEAEYQRSFVLMWLDRELSETELETRNMFYSWCEKHHTDVFGKNKDSEINGRRISVEIYLREFQNKIDHFEEEDYDEVDENVSRIVKAILFKTKPYEKAVSDYHEWERKKLAQTREKRRSKWTEKNRFAHDENKSIDENMAAAERIAQEYLDKFGITANINTPERIALRRQIIAELYGKGAQKKERKAFLVMGLPAGGKSTIAETVAKENGALIIDSDMAKEKLPEFNSGILANAVHVESTGIANRVLDCALLDGDNVVLPVVGSYETDLQEKIQRLNAEGYEVNLYYVGLPMEKALERAQNRFKETGRLVSTSYIKSVGAKPKQNFDKLKTQEGVNSYVEWDNDVDRGQRPRLLEDSTKGLQVQGGLGLGRTQRTRGLDEGSRTPSESTEEHAESSEKVSNYAESDNDAANEPTPLNSETSDTTDNRQEELDSLKKRLEELHKEIQTERVPQLLKSKQARTKVKIL